MSCSKSHDGSLIPVEQSEAMLPADKAAVDRSTHDGLALIQVASKALAEARTIVDVKDVRDKVEAIREYARKSGAAYEVQFSAAEVKLRSERRAGELLSTLELQGGDRKTEASSATLKLADFGINSNQSSRWQQECLVPEDRFQRFLDEARTEGKLPTSTALANLGLTYRLRQRPNRQQLRRKKLRKENATSNWAYNREARESRQPGSAAAHNPPGTGAGGNRGHEARRESEEAEAPEGNESPGGTFSTREEKFANAVFARVDRVLRFELESSSPAVRGLVGPRLLERVSELCGA